MDAEAKIRYDRALRYATEKHRGQFRIGGDEYITHPVAVSDKVKSWGYPVEYRIAALFHDLLEDTDATEAEIAELGGDSVLEAVRLLTKNKGTVMSQYIAGIKSNDMAFTVKKADRLHNLQCAVCADEKFKRKYIAETKEWYLDFSKEIPEALSALSDSLKPTKD